MSSSRTPTVLSFSWGIFQYFHVHLITMCQDQKKNYLEDSPGLHCLARKLQFYVEQLGQLWMGYSSVSSARRLHIRPAVQSNHGKLKIRPNTYMSSEWALKDLMNEKYSYCELTFDFHCLENKADLLVTMQPRKMGTEKECVTLKKGLSQLLLSILWTVCCLDTCPDLSLVPCQGNKIKSELFLPENRIKEL